MGTCQTCRWWERQHFICHRKFVDVPTAEREFKPDSMRVLVWPGGGGKGGYKDIVHNVFTGPDFGCVHHEPLDAQTPPAEAK